MPARRVEHFPTRIAWHRVARSLLCAGMVFALVGSSRSVAEDIVPPSPKDEALGTTVPEQFFGMHVEQQFAAGWPDAPFAVQRIWDVYPPVDWEALNPAPGQYDWENLDRLVSDSAAHGVELVYVFGRAPRWASARPAASCGKARSGSCRVPTPEAWVSFVSAITARYKNRIAYWELWNEPDSRSFWRGTPAQLVDLARRAYPIIEAAGGTVLSPSPQGNNGPRWMSAYLKAGGAPYADINAFHAYLNDAPERLTPLVQAYRRLFSAHGIAARPLWDTEHSWGKPTSPFGRDGDHQAAWLARFQILSADNRIDRSIWYGWHHPNWGTLYDRSKHRLLKPGLAYKQVHQWLIGATVGPCRQTGFVYRCPIRRPNEAPALAVWSTGRERMMTVSAAYTRYRSLEGEVVAIGPSRTATIGMKPILLLP